MPKRFHGSYESRDEVRAQEHADSSMIPSGAGSFANMPTETVMRLYPGREYAMPENLNDKMSGIDHQENTLDKGKMRSHLDPKKV
jgi:hypothetical protein